MRSNAIETFWGGSYKAAGEKKRNVGRGARESCEECRALQTDG